MLDSSALRGIAFDSAACVAVAIDAGTLLTMETMSREMLGVLAAMATACTGLSVKAIVGVQTMRCAALL